MSFLKIYTQINEHAFASQPIPQMSRSTTVFTTRELAPRESFAHRLSARLTSAVLRARPRRGAGIYVLNNLRSKNYSQQKKKKLFGGSASVNEFLSIFRVSSRSFSEPNPFIALRSRTSS